MKLSKKFVLLFLLTIVSVSLCACGSNTKSSSKNTENKDKYVVNETKLKELTDNYKQDNASLEFDNKSWSYDETNNVYWKINIGYCTTPETTEFETMGIFVPGEYMKSEKNSDGTYTCTINTEGKVGNYTAKTAPIVFPLNTPGYAPQASPTDYNYDTVSSYIKEGMIYAYAGMRGKNNGYDDNNKLTYTGGAPWGVTDLKAAVRYYKFNSEILPGDTNSMFTFGHSGGGAQSSLMGASGDNELYFEYLASIGAAIYDKNNKYLSDTICGAMCWCPVTSLDYADAAYEWNMGQFSSTDTRAPEIWTSKLSKELAKSFADYLNKLKLKDEKGTVLTLKESDSGIYTSGTYYDYMVSVVEQSLNNFLSDTTFPYTKEASKYMAGMNAGDQNCAKNSPSGSPSGMKPSGSRPSGMKPGGTAEESKTYETVEDYIKDLNSEEEWVKYDADKNTATITNLESFVKYCKPATKGVPAFDNLDRSAPENYVFGTDEEDALHFDAVTSKLLEKNQTDYSSLSDWNESYVKDYSDDLKSVDKLGNDIEYRQNMYNPMYYLLDYYDGYKKSIPCDYWRIRTGINQGDAASTVEVNLTLALQQYKNIKDVDFQSVWGQGHTMAERTGNSTDNFIAWINKCLNK